MAVLAAVIAAVAYVPKLGRAGGGELLMVESLVLLLPNVGVCPVYRSVTDLSSI